MFLVICEDANIIDINLDVCHISKYVFHHFLGKVGRLFDAHQGSIVLKLAKRSDDDAEFFGDVC
jgi:hypothetical protein